MKRGDEPVHTYEKNVVDDGGFVRKESSPPEQCPVPMWPNRW